MGRRIRATHDNGWKLDRAQPPPGHPAIMGSMSRLFRSLAAFAALSAFLFAQAAASAYACAGPVPDPVAMAQMRADNEGDGGLCEKHCASATQVSFDVAQSTPAPMPAI